MELIALVGVYYMMNGFIRTFVQPSMRMLLRDVRMGTLDFTLTKPEDAQILVSVRSFAIWNLIDAALGAALVVFALVRSGELPAVAQILAFILTLVLGGIIVYSFWLMLATISFWFIKVENLLVIFQSMYQAGRWPVAIYPPLLRIVLTFLVPVAFAVTVPASALVGRITLATLAGTLLAAVGFFVAARLFWKWGVRNYAGASA
jgi:ABC-2 type transport system permease protein